MPNTNPAPPLRRRPAVLAGAPGPAPRRLPPLLRRAWYGLNQAFRRRLARLGLTPDQYTVMRILDESGEDGLSQRQLTDLVCSDPNTMASLLERMAAAGLLERRRHPQDGRAHCIRLRAAGERKLAAALPVALALQSEVLAGLSDTEREGFLEQLERIARACRDALERSPRNGA